MALDQPIKSTIDRVLSDHNSENYTSVVLNVNTGERGTVAEWVERFTQGWNVGADQLEYLLSMISDDITLRAPISPPVTYGKEDSRKACLRTFKAIPDLRADVLRWSSSGDALFIEMIFYATIGGKPISWPHIDVLTFKDGIAIERVAYFDPSKLRKSLFRNLSSLVQLWRLRRG
ncbi:MAG: nuclear transport factor 2 family protein [Henriciella sp.]|nr:nuclear transport factor 2 family protein [Henriciella sp.]